MEIGFRLEWDYDWWGKFETYDWRGDGPEYFKGTKAVHLRLGNSHDRIPMIANVTRWPEAKIIRGFIYLGWRADEQSYDDDNEADTTAIERYRNGERDAPTDDPWSDYYVDDDPDDCEEPPPPWLEILEGESSLPPGL